MRGKHAKKHHLLDLLAILPEAEDESEDPAKQSTKILKHRCSDHATLTDDTDTQQSQAKYGSVQCENPPTSSQTVVEQGVKKEQDVSNLQEAIEVNNEKRPDLVDIVKSNYRKIVSNSTVVSMRKPVRVKIVESRANRVDTVRRTRKRACSQEVIQQVSTLREKNKDNGVKKKGHKNGKGAVKIVCPKCKSLIEPRRFTAHERICSGKTQYAWCPSCPFLATLVDLVPHVEKSHQKTLTLDNIRKLSKISLRTGLRNLVVFCPSCEVDRQKVTDWKDSVVDPHSTSQVASGVIQFANRLTTPYATHSETIIDLENSFCQKDNESFKESFLNEVVENIKQDIEDDKALDFDKTAVQIKPVISSNENSTDCDIVYVKPDLISLTCDKLIQSTVMKAKSIVHETISVERNSVFCSASISTPSSLKANSTASLVMHAKSNPISSSTTGINERTPSSPPANLIPVTVSQSEITSENSNSCSWDVDFLMSSTSRICHSKPDPIPSPITNLVPTLALKAKLIDFNSLQDKSNLISSSVTNGIPSIASEAEATVSDALYTKPHPVLSPCNNITHPAAYGNTHNAECARGKPSSSCTENMKCLAIVDPDTISRGYTSGTASNPVTTQKKSLKAICPQCKKRLAIKYKSINEHDESSFEEVYVRCQACTKLSPLKECLTSIKATEERMSRIVVTKTYSNRKKKIESREISTVDTNVDVHQPTASIKLLCGYCSKLINPDDFSNHEENCCISTTKS
ncbi:hypothetical protein J6590_002372 [Homalodisca vitripennis]|nr:hypothetical protein J6590_002372 [Homalodisca vitripennis]